MELMLIMRGLKSKTLALTIRMAEKKPFGMRATELSNAYGLLILGSPMLWKTHRVLARVSLHVCL